MTNHIAYVQALHRIEQLLTGSLLTGDEDKRVRWRQDARCIADEWGLTPTMRDQLLGEAYEQAQMGAER